MNILNATLCSALRMATPFLFAGLGGLMAQQVGVYNFALEGQMLCGAFFGFLVAYLTKSLLLGALAAIISGLLMGWLLAFICIRFGVSQMVVGLGMNTLLSGVTAFCSRLVNQSLGQGGSIMMEKLLPNITMNTSLTGIPVIGPLIFDQNIMTYTAVILLLAYAWWVKRTPQGLALRAVGEHPHASQTAGINVFRYRYLTMTLSGGIAALGGAFMTLSQVYRFAEDMTGGRGWIAIAAIALGCHGHLLCLPVLRSGVVDLQSAAGLQYRYSVTVCHDGAVYPDDPDTSDAARIQSRSGGSGQTVYEESLTGTRDLVLTITASVRPDRAFMEAVLRQRTAPPGTCGRNSTTRF